MRRKELKLNNYIQQGQPFLFYFIFCFSYSFFVVSFQNGVAMEINIKLFFYFVFGLFQFFSNHSTIKQGIS